MKIHSDYFWRTKNHLNQIMTIKYFQIICIRYASPRIFFILLSQDNFWTAYFYPSSPDSPSHRPGRSENLSSRFLTNPPPPNRNIKTSFKTYFGLRAILNYLRIPNVRILISNKKLKCYELIKKNNIFVW